MPLLAHKLSPCVRSVFGARLSLLARQTSAANSKIALEEQLQFCCHFPIWIRNKRTSLSHTHTELDRSN